VTSFTQTLSDWYRGHKRNLPWRDTKDPYPVWLSEIILQQTRVEQGLPYWTRFMEAYPTVSDLAGASEESVLRLWQGLGYYSRARNLHATAKLIHENFHGQFPNSYEEILKLKGVGPYTAAAIASICFGEPTPVVDGNVFRFASRYFGIEVDIASSGARKKFEEVLLEHIPHSDPGNFNQAMMEFGARVCTPTSPQCDHCPFRVGCFAFQLKRQKDLPVKTKKIKTRERHFHYLVLKKNGKYLMKLRNTKDVWQGLYDFVLLEGKSDEEEVLSKAQLILGNSSFTVERISEEVKHILSHQKILARFYELDISGLEIKSGSELAEINAYSMEEVLNLPKPKLIVRFLEQTVLN